MRQENDTKNWFHFCFDDTVLVITVTLLPNPWVTHIALMQTRRLPTGVYQCQLSGRLWCPPLECILLWNTMDLLGWMSLRTSWLDPDLETDIISFWFYVLRMAFLCFVIFCFGDKMDILSKKNKKYKSQTCHSMTVHVANVSSMLNHDVSMWAFVSMCYVTCNMLRCFDIVNCFRNCLFCCSHLYCVYNFVNIGSVFILNSVLIISFVQEQRAKYLSLVLAAASKYALH